jgi:hypothetical protein
LRAAAARRPHASVFSSCSASPSRCALREGACSLRPRTTSPSTRTTPRPSR